MSVFRHLSFFEDPERTRIFRSSSSLRLAIRRTRLPPSAIVFPVAEWQPLFNLWNSLPCDVTPAPVLAVLCPKTYFPTRECGVVCVRSYLSVCLSVCLSVRALTFEGLDVEASLLACRYSFGISRSTLYVKVIG